MKRNGIFTPLILASSILIAVPMVHAQSVGQALGQALTQFFAPQNESASMDQLRKFDHFLQDHPEIARELRQRPRLVNDRDFVDHHPVLRDWLNDHPETATAFRENPDAFMDRERHFQQYNGDFASGDTRRGELAHFDWFLDSHPEIRSDLMRRPELALHDEYLNNHPDLKVFLDRHPAVRDQLRDNPKGFMDREARLENRQAENGQYGNGDHSNRDYDNR